MSKIVTEFWYTLDEIYTIFEYEQEFKLKEDPNHEFRFLLFPCGIDEAIIFDLYQKDMCNHLTIINSYPECMDFKVIVTAVYSYWFYFLIVETTFEKYLSFKGIPVPKFEFTVQ